MPVIQPYKHDCDQCIWVGWVPWSGGRWGNMYLHSNKGAPGLCSIVVRFSDEPSDYWSSPVGASVRGGLSMDLEAYDQWVAAETKAEELDQD